MTKETLQHSRTRRAAPRGSEENADGGPRRVTTSLVMLPYQLALFRQVANLRTLKGRTHAGEDGVERRYSMSALILELLGEAIPGLEKELLDSGLPLPVAD